MNDQAQNEIEIDEMEDEWAENELKGSEFGFQDMSGEKFDRVVVEAVPVLAKVMKNESEVAAKGTWWRICLWK